MCAYIQAKELNATTLLYHFLLCVQHHLRRGFSRLVIPLSFAFLGRLEGEVQFVVSVVATLPQQTLQRNVFQQGYGVSLITYLLLVVWQLDLWTAGTLFCWWFLAALDQLERRTLQVNHRRTAKCTLLTFIVGLCPWRSCCG